MKCLIALLFVCGIAACNEPAKPTASVKEKFDAIEKIVGTANWELVTPGDTSFVYFSRLGDTYINVYKYKLVNGDSANTQVSNMISRQDTIAWTGTNEQYILSAVTDSAIIWQDMSNGDKKYTISKYDSTHISLSSSGRSELMKRTLPLSVFLVRKKYDYLHGTAYADSAEVAPRPVKQSK